MSDERAKTYLTGEFAAAEARIKGQVPVVEAGLLAWLKAHRKTVMLVVGSIALGSFLRACGIL